MDRGVLCHCGFYGFVWWRPWNEPANGRTRDGFIRSLLLFLPGSSFLLLTPNTWINISRQLKKHTSTEWDFLGKICDYLPQCLVVFLGMKAACNRTALEKLKCFGKIPIEWKLMLLLPHLCFTLSCVLSLSFFTLFLSLSLWVTC